MWGWIGIEQLLQDVRYGMRILIKNPGYNGHRFRILALRCGPRPRPGILKKIKHCKEALDAQH